MKVKKRTNDSITTVLVVTQIFSVIFALGTSIVQTHRIIGQIKGKR